MHELGRRLIIMPFLFFLVFSHVYGQDNVLICPKQIQDKFIRANEVLQKSEAYFSVEFVEIKLDKIIDYECFILKIDDDTISIKKERIEVRDVNSYVFYGGNDQNYHVLLSVLEKDIQGVVETPEKVYAVETLGEEYVLIQLDYSRLKEACADLRVEPQYLFNNEEQNHNIDDYNDTVVAIEDGLSTTYLCKIRVLVLYTSEAQLSVSNIKNTILTAVALTNQSFFNSQIHYQLELVYAGRTNYDEVGIFTDLNRFQTDGDGYMDEVHVLRNKYSADVCVLLSSDDMYCGLATGIGVSANNAFCAVSSKNNCATTNYSFGHEIGHLLGCMHDPYVDNNTTPFAYGHGYVHLSGQSWRTIMAYGNACNYCPRLQYWSNPSVYYGGSPMGTISTHNNSRVWTERSNYVMSFSQPSNYAFVSNNSISNGQYADIIAKKEISTNGVVNVDSGNTVHMRAGESIYLKNGFHVYGGAFFSATNENICDCGKGSPNNSSRMTIQDLSDAFEDIDEKEINIPAFSCVVFPNPSEELINIDYSLIHDGLLSIELINLFGQKVGVVLHNQFQSKGNHHVQMPISALNSGTYFLIISFDNNKTTRKIVIK